MATLLSATICTDAARDRASAATTDNPASSGTVQRVTIAATHADPPFP